MKAILVIDIPDGVFVEDCVINYEVQESVMQKTVSAGVERLRPLPIKNKYKHDSMATIDHENDITLADYQNFGRNACLDEITGETE